MMLDTRAVEMIQDAVRGEHRLDGLVSSLLDTLATIVGVECAYVAWVDRDRGQLEIHWSTGRCGCMVRDGQRLPWTETMTGPVVLSASSATAIPPGARTVLSVPVVTADGTLIATLAAASAREIEVDEGIIAVAELLARLIGDQALIAEMAGSATQLIEAQRRVTAAEESARESRLALHDAVLDFRRRLREARNQLIRAETRIASLRDRLVRFRHRRTANAIRRRRGHYDEVSRGHPMGQQTGWPNVPVFSHHLIHRRVITWT